MIKTLLIHPKTYKNIASFIAEPGQALLLVGEKGSGKRSLALAIGSAVLKIPPATIAKYPYFLEVSKADGSLNVGIDQIREIIRLLKLKVPGKPKLKRIIFINDAESMNEEAQNALLKVLEEPNPDTIFILSSTPGAALLPTIVSRTSQIAVFPVSFSHSKQYFSGQDTAKIEKNWQLSGGLPGLLFSLLTDKSHELRDSIDEAKNFLSLDKLHRHLFLRNFRSKIKVKLFLESLNKLLVALHRNAINKEQLLLANKLLSDRRTVAALSDALDKNVSPRLIVLSLSLNLKV